jgi:glyoxylase-like metal-dependent hydrolase (beta-lactamase superfamily II)
MTLHQDLGHNTYHIDILLYRPRLAACYLVHDSNEFALIDCGTKHSVPQVLDAIAAAGGTPEQVRWIIPTHVHLDHASGAGQLMDRCPNATLVAHPKGAPHMIDPSKLQAGATAVYGEAAFARDYGELLPVPEQRCIIADDGQSFALGQRQLTFIDTPGHANHHGCILDSASGYLFTGDTFGLGYREFATPAPYIIATSSPVAFDPDAWQNSLDKILALNPQAVCLTHFSKYPTPEAWAPMLRDSIEAHREIALAEENNTQAGRHERLLKALDTLLVGNAIKHCHMPEQQARDLLAVDKELNAQGLGIWLKRRSKQREASR